MTAPRWEDVPEEERDYVTRVLHDDRARLTESIAWATRRGGPVPKYGHRIDALDAALARLAEPAQPSAAERWRAVPERIRRETLARLERHADEWAAPRAVDAEDAAHRAAAGRALLALAREAEGAPAPAEPAPPTRTPCHRCGKPLARRGVYHVCPHRIPCSAGWCVECTKRSGT